MVFWLIGMGVAVSFLLGGVMGAPWVPTLRTQRHQALNLLKLRPGMTLLDLGCGSGTLLAEAARRGVRGIGYELNPIMFVFAKLRCWPYRSLVKIYLRDYWRVNLPPADGIYVFLTKRYMSRLDQKLSQSITKPTKLVSYSFSIAGKQAVVSKHGLHLYQY